MLVTDSTTDPTQALPYFPDSGRYNCITYKVILNDFFLLFLIMCVCKYVPVSVYGYVHVSAEAQGD